MNNKSKNHQPKLKVVLVSSKYLFNDPRNLLFAHTYKKIGYDVLCLNLNAKITKENKNTELYKKFLCISGYDLYKKKFPLKKSTASKISREQIKHNHLLQKAIKFLKFTIVNEQLLLLFIKIKIKIREILLRPIYLIISILKIRWLIKHFDSIKYLSDVSIFHSCEFFLGAYGASKLAKKFHADFIIDAKEYHSEMVPEHSHITLKLIKHLERKYFNQAKMITCVSQGIIKCYQETYYPLKDKFTYIPNALSKEKQDNDYYNQSLNLSSIKSSKVRFVLLSDYLPFVRGIEYLIKIWDFLPHDQAEIHMYLSNMNSIYLEYLKKIIGNNYNKNLFIMNPIKQESITSELSKYDIGIIPYLPEASLNHLYCAPGKFGQYLKANLAIMTTDSLNLSSLVKSNNLGYIYPSNNITTAVQTFSSAIQDKNKILTYKVSSRKFFQDTYHWENFTKAFVHKLIDSQTI